MARDARGYLINTSGSTVSTGTTGGWYDLGTGTPRRGVPVAWRTSFSAATAGTVATLTIEASDDKTAVETIGTFPPQTATTAAVGAQNTITVSTQRRWVRANLTLAGGGGAGLVHDASFSTANPT